MTPPRDSRLDEKLDWARTHLLECKGIATAAQEFALKSLTGLLRSPTSERRFVNDLEEVYSGHGEFDRPWQTRLGYRRDVPRPGRSTGLAV